MSRSLATLCLVALVSSAAFAAPQGKKAQVKDAPLVCPVMGAKIAAKDKAVGSQVYKGVKYFFCCGGCPGAFKKDPAKYVKTFKETCKRAGVKVSMESATRLVSLKSCPMSGEKIKNASIKTTVGKYEVPFCCEGCKTHFENLPGAEKERKIAQLAEKH